MFHKVVAINRPAIPLLKHHRKTRPLSTMVTTFLVVAGVPLGLYTYKCIMLIAFQNQLIYMGYLPPGSRHNENFKKLIPSSLEIHEETILTEDRKRLHGFIVSKKSAQSASATFIHAGLERSDPIMVYFQGNAGNMSDRFGLFKTALSAVPNMTIIGIGYRQYGNSNGYATESGLKRDAKAILDKIQRKYGPNRPLYLYGHSLGGAVAIDLASTVATNKEKYNIQGIIIENTFTSIYDMVCALYPAYSPYPYIAKYCLWNHWDSDRKIRSLPPSIRLLFLSSKRDEIVPPSHMKQLYSLAQHTHPDNATFVQFERSLHMDIYSTEPRLFQCTLQKFII
ncbi:Alpha/Beta hydrolase protein [Absidia repens]|uniref:Alpha/Beta hydrolase protein n=1 Tax=Absidia repens TaxID=90262 RepID=A0A1X2I8D0_9FUNG|nr:Alpha/Beta hydrolase protein [Absidia repens]